MNGTEEKNPLNLTETGQSGTPPGKGAKAAPPAAKTGEDAKPGKEPTPKPQAFESEDSEEEFTLPDGFEAGDYADRFKEVAKELNLTREDAGKLLSFWSEVAADVEASQEDAWNDARRHWATETMRDREIGGENLERSVSVAARVVNSFGTEGLKEVFRATGLGNHPEVIRFITKIGNAFGEDALVSGPKTSTSAGKSAAELIYGRK